MGDTDSARPVGVTSVSLERPESEGGVLSEPLERRGLAELVRCADCKRATEKSGYVHVVVCVRDEKRESVCESE